MSIRQIALSLGISPSAVSLALRNSEKISEETRLRVNVEARRLGYRPDAKLKELMSHLRRSGPRQREACFGVVSLYDSLRPWERSLHLKRIYESMTEKAEELGYRLEPLQMKSPGMTERRFGEILDARGIQGLLCFGSPNLTDTFPSQLDHYAVVTQGLSIASPLHRVTSHFYNDLTRTLDRVYAKGYRRPGLVLGEYEEIRSARAYTSAYFGWCEYRFGRPSLVPILRLQKVEERPLLSWLESHTPDVVIFVHLYDVLADVEAILAANSIKVPESLGFAVVTQILEGTRFSGMEQNQKLIGAWSIESLVSRIMNQDVGFPANPRIEMVESRWVEGHTLRG